MKRISEHFHKTTELNRISNDLNQASSTFNRSNKTRGLLNSFEHSCRRPKNGIRPATNLTDRKNYSCCGTAWDSKWDKQYEWDQATELVQQSHISQPTTSRLGLTNYDFHQCNHNYHIPVFSDNFSWSPASESDRSISSNDDHYYSASSKLSSNSESSYDTCRSHWQSSHTMHRLLALTNSLQIYCPIDRHAHYFDDSMTREYIDHTSKPRDSLDITLTISNERIPNTKENSGNCKFTASLLPVSRANARYQDKRAQQVRELLNSPLHSQLNSSLVTGHKLGSQKRFRYYGYKRQLNNKAESELCSRNNDMRDNDYKRWRIPEKPPSCGSFVSIASETCVNNKHLSRSDESKAPLSACNDKIKNKPTVLNRQFSRLLAPEKSPSCGSLVSIASETFTNNQHLSEPYGNKVPLSSCNDKRENKLTALNRQFSWSLLPLCGFCSEKLPINKVHEKEKHFSGAKTEKNSEMNNFTAQKNLCQTLTSVSQTRSEKYPEKKARSTIYEKQGCQIKCKKSLPYINSTKSKPANFITQPKSTNVTNKYKRFANKQKHKKFFFHHSNINTASVKQINDNPSSDTPVFPYERLPQQLYHGLYDDEFVDCNKENSQVNHDTQKYSTPVKTSFLPNVEKPDQDKNDFGASNNCSNFQKEQETLCCQAADFQPLSHAALSEELMKDIEQCKTSSVQLAKVDNLAVNLASQFCCKSVITQASTNLFNCVPLQSDKPTANINQATTFHRNFVISTPLESAPLNQQQAELLLTRVKKSHLKELHGKTQQLNSLQQSDVYDAEIHDGALSSSSSVDCVNNNEAQLKHTSTENIPALQLCNYKSKGVLSRIINVDNTPSNLLPVYGSIKKQLPLEHPLENGAITSRILTEATDEENVRALKKDYKSAPVRTNGSMTSCRKQKCSIDLLSSKIPLPTPTIITPTQHLASNIIHRKNCSSYKNSSSVHCLTDDKFTIESKTYLTGNKNRSNNERSSSIIKPFKILPFSEASLADLFQPCFASNLNSTSNNGIGTQVTNSFTEAVKLINIDGSNSKKPVTQKTGTPSSCHLHNIIGGSENDELSSKGDSLNLNLVKINKRCNYSAYALKETNFSDGNTCDTYHKRYQQLSSWSNYKNLEGAYGEMIEDKLSSVISFPNTCSTVSFAAESNVASADESSRSLLFFIDQVQKEYLGAKCLPSTIISDTSLTSMSKAIDSNVWCKAWLEQNCYEFNQYYSAESCNMDDGVSFAKKNENWHIPEDNNSLFCNEKFNSLSLSQSDGNMLKSAQAKLLSFVAQLKTERLNRLLYGPMNLQCVFVDDKFYPPSSDTINNDRGNNNSNSQVQYEDETAENEVYDGLINQLTTSQLTLEIIRNTEAPLEDKNVIKKDSKSSLLFANIYSAQRKHSDDSSTLLTATPSLDDQVNRHVVPYDSRSSFQQLPVNKEICSNETHSFTVYNVNGRTTFIPDRVNAHKKTTTNQHATTAALIDDGNTRSASERNAEKIANVINPQYNDLHLNNLKAFNTNLEHNGVKEICSNHDIMNQELHKDISMCSLRRRRYTYRHGRWNVSKGSKSVIRLPQNDAESTRVEMNDYEHLNEMRYLQKIRDNTIHNICATHASRRRPNTKIEQTLKRKELKNKGDQYLNSRKKCGIKHNNIGRKSCQSPSMQDKKRIKLDSYGWLNSTQFQEHFPARQDYVSLSASKQMKADKRNITDKECNKYILSNVKSTCPQNECNKADVSSNIALYSKDQIKLDIKQSAHLTGDHDTLSRSSLSSNKVTHKLTNRKHLCSRQTSVTTIHHHQTMQAADHETDVENGMKEIRSSNRCWRSMHYGIIEMKLDRSAATSCDRRLTRCFPCLRRLRAKNSIDSFSSPSYSSTAHGPKADSSRLIKNDAKQESVSPFTYERVPASLSKSNNRKVSKVYLHTNSITSTSIISNTQCTFK